jgi:hypothetical protein
MYFYTETVLLRLTRAAKNQIDHKMPLLYPCVKCHGLMTLDYCMPNRIYVDKDNKDFRGVKQMKSKERVTLMVSSSGCSRVPF